MSTTDRTTTGLPVQRIEALTDGIFAVAMTLLVIELRLPEHDTLHGPEALAQALADLLPKVVAWIISFAVLGYFWFGHHRAFAHLRRTDGRLIAINIGQLGCVSLLPFSSALVGEHGREWLSQVIYSANMIAIAVMALLLWRHVHRHPDTATPAMPEATYRAARFRLWALIAISLLAVAVQYVAPTLGNVAFVLMAVVMPVSRRMERAGAAR